MVSGRPGARGGAGTRRAAVVFNPTKVERGRLEAVVAAAEAKAGWAPSLWLETTAQDPGVGMAHEAVAEGCAVVLGVGGDGTIRALAEGLRGSDVPLAVCPRGTGNLLARNLGLPLDDVAACVAAGFSGVERHIDVGVAAWTRPDGEFGEHTFAVMAGMGLDAQIMSSTDEKLKKRVGMLAYVKTGVGALLRDRRMKVNFRLDDGPPFASRVHTVLVGNCGSIGYNVMLMPDAVVDDGRLDVVAVEPRGPFGWVRVGWTLLVENPIFRRHRTRRQMDLPVKYRQCERIEVWLHEPEEIELDGDDFGEVRTVEVRVEPRALRVMMPRGWEHESR